MQNKGNYMINKPFFNSCWLLGSWYLKECICAFLFSLYVNNFGKKYPNRWDFQNRILNDFFLSLKDKKLKRCPSCNVLPFSLDRLGQDFSCRLRTHCGCFCASWVSLFFLFTTYCDISMKYLTMPLFSFKFIYKLQL